LRAGRVWGNAEEQTWFYPGVSLASNSARTEAGTPRRERLSQTSRDLARRDRRSAGLVLLSLCRQVRKRPEQVVQGRGRGQAREYVSLHARLEEAIDWVKRCPNPMPEDSEIEIRPFYEAADFGEVFTPELQAQAEWLQAE